MSNYPPKPNFRTPDQAARAAMFGAFRYQPTGGGNIRILGSWAAENIVRVRIKQLAGIEGCNKDGIILFHRYGVEQVEGFFDTVERRGLQNRILTWGGSYVPRFIRGSNSVLSNHAFGSAFDINAAWNGLGKIPAAAGQKGSVIELVSIANDFGFFWGGHYSSRLDGMHFELAVLKRFPKTYFVLSNHDLTPENVGAAIEANKLESSGQSAIPDFIPSVSTVLKPSTNSPDLGQTDPTEIQAQPIQETTKVEVNQGEIKVETSNAPPPEPKTEIVNAPPKENSTATATKATILGITVPAFVGVAVKAVTDLVSQGFVSSAQIGEFVLNLIRENQKYVLWIVIALIVLLGLKKLCKQITLWFQMWFAGNRETNNVEVKPQ